MAAAALAVVDRDGLAGLTMRDVAGELGMGTMSLYRYVSGRERLEGLIVDHVLSGVDLAPPPRASWQRRIAVLMTRVRDAMEAHPEVVPLMLTNRHAAAGSLRWGEVMLGILTEAGFSGRRRVVALRALLSYLTGALQLEHLGPLSGAGTDAMAALPEDDFPLLAATARTARTVSADREFRDGLDALLAGLHATTP
jgi:AcrR family transcriptional regulator